MSAPVSFVSIDFETANPHRASPIQIGVVRVIDGEVQEPFTLPVQPPPHRAFFHPSNTRVHGLGPPYIIGAPKWGEILERLDAFTVEGAPERLPLYAHNAVFERSVIEQTSRELGLTPPRFRYVCSVRMAKQLPLGTVNNKLDTLARHFGITQVAHHDAGDDARVGAQLALRLIQSGAEPGKATLPH